MILTELQILAIKQHLSYEVKYQETFNEVFDHVMLVISDMPDSETVYPETLTNQVIEQEFGGYNNLKTMEGVSAKLAFKEMRKKHWTNITYFLNWPVIVFTIAIIIAGYYFCLNPVNRKYLITFTIICALLPTSYLFVRLIYRKYRDWYHNDYHKASIKDGYIFNAALLSSSIINVLLNVMSKSFILIAPVSLVVFVMYTIYVLSFFKLYRQEFRMNIAR